MPITANNLIRVRRNDVREFAPRCSDGSLAVLIDCDNGALVYEGTSRVEAVAALQKLGIGVSVTVDHPCGMRSCMNKPALWRDVLEL